MFQGARFNLFNPLVPKADNSECQNLPFLLQIKPAKVAASWRIFKFSAPSELLVYDPPPPPPRAFRFPKILSDFLLPESQSSYFVFEKTWEKYQI